MSSANNFNLFYENELKHLLTPLEEDRRKIKKYGIAGFFFLGAAILLFIISAASHNSGTAVIAFILILSALILLIVFGNKKKSFAAGFKETIVRKIIHFIDPSLTYNPHLSISKTDYLNSGLFVEQPDRYSGDDYIEGTHEKTFFCFSELHTERKVSSGKSTHWETIFRGLFFIADFNKNFSGRTYVWSERNPQINFLTKLFSSFAWNLEKVKLESVEFEKRFIVYSSDQVEARYILTPSFMERIVRLQQLMGEGTSLSFVNTNIHVAVPIKDELFEPAIFSANDNNRLGDFYNTINIVFDIIDELKLNQRLWNKE
ncbi:MAG TPA: DUF3137 domain-containing protein [Chitinophagaceae bacterium]|nr:DUF3137 domain-containing protein [Chitinophagaceae bacterium]HNU14780.1 DUF3137 domain-containing protein [Chitinophagaceae bacterium]